MKFNGKRIMAFVLTLCMLISVLPPVVLASNGDGDGAGETPVTVTYDFALGTGSLTYLDKNSTAKPFTGAGITDSYAKSAISQYYTDGTLNWKFITDNREDFEATGRKISSNHPFGGNSSWSGLRTSIKDTDASNSSSFVYPQQYWLAFEIDVDVAGTYALTLNHQTRKDGTTAGELYVLPGSYTDVAGIAADLANAQKVNAANINYSSNSFTCADAQSTLGNATLAAGANTLVFKSNGPSPAAQANIDANVPVTSCTSMYLNSLVMVKQADPDPDEVVTQTYDFALGTGSLTYLDKNSTAKPFTGAGITDGYAKSAISQYYTDGTLNWKFIADNREDFEATGRKISSNHPFGGNSSWSGLRTSIKDTDASNSSSFVYPQQYWLAFEIDVDVAGTYALTLNHQTRKDGTTAGELYVLPGSYTDVAGIAADLANAQKVNAANINYSSNSFTCADAQSTLGNATLAAGANTLVFKSNGPSPAAQANIDANVPVTSCTSMYLNSLVIVKQTESIPEETTAAPEETTAAPEETTAAPEETTVPSEIEPVDYSFELGASALTKTDGTSMAGGTLTDKKIAPALSDYYNQGVISWKYALDNISTLATDTHKSSNTFYFGGGSNPWSGLKLGVMLQNKTDSSKNYPAGYWAAFTVKSPGAGNFQVGLDYQVRKDGTPNGEIYILPGTYTDMAAIEALLTRDNLRKVVDFTSNTYTFAEPVSADLGVMTFAEGEYTIVFKGAKAATGANIYINELTFTATEAPEDQPELPEEEEPIVLKQEGYTFELGASSLVNNIGGSFEEAILTTNENKSILEQYYKDGYINWKYALDNISSFATETHNAGNTFFFGGKNNPWTGLKLGMMLSDKTDSTKKSYPAGWWAAFTVKSPGAGTYDIKLDYQVRADGTTAGEIYLVKGTFTDAKALEAKLTKDNLLKSIDFSSKTFTLADASRSLGIVAFENCEYTLVVKAAEGTPGKAYAYVNDLTFTPAQPKPVLGPVQTDKLVYDFQLGTSGLTLLDGKPMTGNALDSKGMIEALDEYFKDQKLYWKYAADNLDSFNKEGASVSSTFFVRDEAQKYLWKGFRAGVKVSGPEVNEAGKKISTYPAGWWLAMNIHAPGTGTYHLTLDYQARADATTAAEIYLIKGGLTDAVEIEKQLTAENLIDTIDMKGKTFDLLDKSVYLGAVEFQQGEYTLVVKAAAESGNKSAYTYLTKLTADTQAPPEPTEIIYDFDLCDKTNGIWSGKKLLKDVTSNLADMYSAGKLNWKYENKAFTLDDGANAFADHYGMVMYTSEQQWMAFRIKSPGSGVYTLSLNHATSGRGALGAVFVLPGDATDVEKAMDYSNRVGKVNFCNKDGSTTIENKSTTTLGTFTFEKGKEYIVVFEANKSSNFVKDIGYMWISQLIAKKGDHTMESATGGRVIKPFVVNPEPCKTMEVNLYMTTSVINGQDYLFLGTEGHQLFVCNLEDMVRERVVRTPFGISRAMTTDKDGMIWVGGDAAVLWRYDPYTNTSMTTRNYKLAGGIDSTSSAFSMTSDEDGNIYFGSYSQGYVVQYNPQTDQFKKMGGRINEDCQYSCGVVVKDGFLYAAVSGDANSDGVRTAEAVKIDIASNTVVGRTDIYEQFGDKEVMVRGANICGDTLFMGGISMEGFVAIDINTMELKDYGIPKQINYAPSEVVDGKCYLRVQDYGMYEYDSATDTMTKIKNMDTASVGFRTTPHSAVTLSNNPLFPGISHVTASTTGIKIYNFETKNVWTAPLYDEDTDGAGQLIRVIVRGEEGDPNIYMGAFNTVNCAKFNTETGETTMFEATSAQTDAMLWYEGSLYVGNYNAGNLVKINFEDPERNVIMLKFKEQYHQSRVHAITAGDDYLITSTIPDSFLYGGCLAVINLKTQARVVEENLIENQCIIALTYHDGIVIGGSSVAGGTGASGSATGKESAVIFAYDVTTNELLATLDLRDHLPNMPEQLNHINGLVADPDIANNGKYWGLYSETLFSFTFDKETKTFDVKLELTFDKPGTSSQSRTGWDDCSWAFDDEGYIYVPFNGASNAGLRKVNMANPQDNVRIDVATPHTFTLGPDGNLYYSENNAILKMYPLNVTEDDWQSAEAVDALIAAIGTVTLDSKDAIEAARAAYEGLSLKHKALVQDLETLEIAEIDLLECMIDTIGEVTLDKREMIEGLVAKYESLDNYQKRFVKNYAVLNEADMALQGLINAQVAAEMQKIIDAMKDAKDITLDDYDNVMGIKEKYDALKFLQRQLVDATKLEAALAKITELRQEKIEHLKKLIASIGEVTLEDEPIIVEAVAIFDWLTLDERNQVDYITLNAAEKALKKLQKAAAEEVDALIEAIGEVKRSSGKAIEAARAAYDALTEGSKAYVKLLDTLLAAEAAYAELGGLGVVGTIAVVVAVVAAAGIGVTLVIVKKPNLLKRKQKVAAETEAEE